MKQPRIIIAGAGHAGAQCAISLRQLNYNGPILMVGREPELPYERPPLSKDYFSGQKEFERLLIRPEQFWKDKNVELCCGVSVTFVDPAKKRVRLSNGESFEYGSLIWAAGGDPRRLDVPGSDLECVHSIRTREDCDKFKSVIANGARNIVVIGGGYLGLEASAALTKMNCNVTLLEAMPRILARVAGPQISAFFEGEHRAHGVDVRTGVEVKSLLGQTCVTGVQLGDGSVLATDSVISGIGIVATVDPLREAGAKCGNGVVVDEYCQTSLADIYAIGDCAQFACDYADGTFVRVESVQNAHDQAMAVAKTLCGDRQRYQACPWFWSNQFDVKLQSAGLSMGYDQAVVRGSPEDKKFSVIYLKGGRIIAIDCVNMVKDYVQGKKLVETFARPDLERIAKTCIPLKDA